MVLKPSVLDAGYRYTLSVFVKAFGREEAVGVMDLIANYQPYNGTCYTEPKQGENCYLYKKLRNAIYIYSV